MSDRAYYEGLPIYKAAMDLVVAMDAAVRGFSRHHKYGIGLELRQASLRVVQLIARANQREFRVAARSRPWSRLRGAAVGCGRAGRPGAWPRLCGGRGPRGACCGRCSARAHHSLVDRAAAPYGPMVAAGHWQRA